MSHKIINGGKLAYQLVANIATNVLSIQNQYTKTLSKSMIYPRLGIIMVGNHPASLSYIRRKKYLSHKANIKTRLFHIDDVGNMEPAQIGKQITRIIDKLNNDQKYHGILLQLPLDSKVADRETEFLNMIAPKKDVDCLGNQNLQNFENVGIQANLKPCVVVAVLQMLKSKKIQIDNKNILIIGKGRLVGMPLYSMLSKYTQKLKIVDDTNTIEQIKQLAKQSDIVLSATGKPDLLQSEDFKKGCVIVDIGCSPDPDKPGKVRGDFKQSVKKEVTQHYTPVPKGVGPMVVASLIQNVYKAWVEQIGKQKRNKRNNS